LGDAELELNRRVLERPPPNKEFDLSKLGWEPRGQFEVAERRAIQEIEQVGRFNEDSGGGVAGSETS
jgi:hypothetical protein